MKLVRTPGIEVAVAAGLALVAMVGGVWLHAATVPAYDVAWTAGAACGLLGMLAARRAAVGDLRATWTWFSLAAGCWLVGQLAWDAFGVFGSPASPNLADLGWWGFAALVVVGLLHAPGLRVVRCVEALPLVASAMALTCSLMWSHAVRSPLPVVGRVSALVYPTLYVSAAVVTLQAMVAGVLRRSRGAGVPLVLLGVAAQALAFILWSRQLLDADYVVGRTLVDPLFVLGLVAIGTGGAATARGSAVDEAAEREPGERAVLLPALMFVLLIAALLHAQVHGMPPGARLALTGGLTICGMTLVARGVLLAVRQRALLAGERDARQALARREAELERLTQQLAEDSRRDPLTGLRNRRALGEDLVAVEELTRRRGGSYAVALCDVDRFKAYNDLLGHLAGDEALRAIASIVRGELRAGDAAYRYGGEELLIVLQDADVNGALEVADRLRRAVAAAGIRHPSGIDGVVTVSIGVAAGNAAAAALIADADAALYAAKHAGRNRVTTGGGRASSPAHAAPAPEAPAQPGVRHLQSLLAVSRAGRRGEGAVPVLAALAQVIRSELRFATVVGNLRRGEALDAVVVLGDGEARDALLGTSAPWSEWERMLHPAYERCGAFWLPAGSYEWSEDVTVWTPTATAGPAADAWHPEDALLLPLRDSSGEVLAVVAVDEPLSGRRPSDEELEVLMAVADHGAAVLEQIADVAAAGSEQQLAAVLLLAESLDLRDAATARHSVTVGEFARATAHELGLPAERVERIRVAGVVHDLGKLAIPDAILHKPGRLDDGEWREMHRHPEVGARILIHAGLHDIAGWVHAHHERVDGRGYPHGLADSDIPLEAKILAVADAYEAMIADRPYRAGREVSAARQELRDCAGTQFDPAVVDAFLRTRAIRDAPPGLAARPALSR